MPGLPIEHGKYYLISFLLNYYTHVVNGKLFCLIYDRSSVEPNTSTSVCRDVLEKNLVSLLLGNTLGRSTSSLRARSNGPGVRLSGMQG